VKISKAQARELIEQILEPHMSEADRYKEAQDTIRRQQVADASAESVTEARTRQPRRINPHD